MEGQIHGCTFEQFKDSLHETAVWGWNHGEAQGWLDKQISDANEKFGIDFEKPATDKNGFKAEEK